LTQLSEPTVFLLDDDPAVRQSMGALTRSLELPMKILESANEFLDAFNPLQSGCLVFDVRLLGLHGLEFFTKLHEGEVFFAAIALAANADVSTAVHAMRAGAINFLQKPLDEPQLFLSIQEALNRDAEHRRRQSQMERIRRRLEKLTKKESDVLKLIMAGKLNREIADMLKISLRTVEERRSKITQKMKAASLPEMIREIVLYEYFSEKSLF
jgi:RNA polymerase sigma factor (sigma-70 family)